VSNELLEDSGSDLAAYIANECAYQFAKAEDQAGFIGDSKICAFGREMKGADATMKMIGSRPMTSTERSRRHRSRKRKLTYRDKPRLRFFTAEEFAAMLLTPDDVAALAMRPDDFK